MDKYVKFIGPSRSIAKFNGSMSGLFTRGHLYVLIEDDGSHACLYTSDEPYRGQWQFNTCFKRPNFFDMLFATKHDR